MRIEVVNLSDEKYESHIKAVLSECPDADEAAIKDAFIKYEEEFYIPPQDALRSIIRRFQGEKQVGSSVPAGSTNEPKPTKKVKLLSELLSNDRDIEIEVEVISHNLREQVIRGEQRKIAFGLIEDSPWGDSSEKNRWEYKDWGPNSNITPGSVIRIEGASVNEFQGRMSLNINQSTRIAVLREGTRPVNDPSEPIQISNVPKEGYICVVGRVLSSRNDQIHRKDGSGSIEVVRGRIADESGTIGFLSWEPFDYKVGNLIKVDGAQVKTFRDTPELNFGRTTKIEAYHDSNFADEEKLKTKNIQKISQLTDGQRDVETVVQIIEWEKRSFTKDGEERYLWSGQIADPTGRCRISAWQDLPLNVDNLPITIKLTGVRVRAWQGIPDITVDRADQVEVLTSPPWDESIDLSDHIVEVGLTELVSSSSRVGICTSANVVSVREDSGIIMRCDKCRRVLRDGECVTHGETAGEEDVRLRMVLDDGLSTASLLANKEASLTLTGMEQSEIKELVDLEGQMAFVQELRNKLLGRTISASGRSIVDNQGAMILADSVSLIEEDAVLLATEVRNRWGVI